MGVNRPWRAYGFLDEDLSRRIGNVIFTADDVGDAHLEIINDYRQMIERLLHAFGYHKVLELRRVELNFAANQIGKYDFLIWVLEADDFRTQGYRVQG